MYEFFLIVCGIGMCVLLVFMIDRQKRQTQKLAQLNVLIKALESKYEELCEAALKLNEEIAYLKK